MPRKKFIYKYNPHTLSYEKVSVTLKERLKKVSFTVLFAVVTGVLMTVLFVTVIDSPKEAALKREIAQYRRELRTLESRVERDGQVLEDLESRDSAVYRTIFGAAPLRPEARRPEPHSFDHLEGYDCKGEIPCEDIDIALDNWTKRRMKDAGEEKTHRRQKPSLSEEELADLMIDAMPPHLEKKFKELEII